MVWAHALISLIFMQLSNFLSKTCWRGCLFPIVQSCRLCQRLIDHKCPGLFLFSLSCCTDLFLFMSVAYCLIALVLQCNRSIYSIFSMAYLFSICPLFWNLKTSILMLLNLCVISYFLTKTVMSYKRKRNDVFLFQYATHSAKSKKRRK